MAVNGSNSIQEEIVDNHSPVKEAADVYLASGDVATPKDIVTSVLLPDSDSEDTESDSIQDDSTPMLGDPTQWNNGSCDESNLVESNTEAEVQGVEDQQVTAEPSHELHRRPREVIKQRTQQNIEHTKENVQRHISEVFPDASPAARRSEWNTPLLWSASALLLVVAGVAVYRFTRRS